MKHQIIITIGLLLLLSGVCFVCAQEDSTMTVTDSAENLDLQAVSELFKESENLEAFEKSLNDPELGINNLDLDENGEIDFVRVIEEVADDDHVVVLQACLGDDEFQDVAIIQIEKTDDDYTMQIEGNEELYGANFYVVPVAPRIITWPIIAAMVKPAYIPYWSKYYYGVYPGWWRVYHPVARSIYVNRTVVFTKRAGFKFTKVGRARVTKTVRYRPCTSTLVKKKVVRTPKGTKVITTKKRPGKKPVVKKTKVKRK